MAGKDTAKMDKEETIEAYWAVSKEIVALNEQKRALKKAWDGFEDAERLSGILNVDTGQLSAEERKTLLELVAKAGAAPGDARVEVNQINQNTGLDKG